LAYANFNQPSTLGRSIQADLDVTMQGRLQSSREFSRGVACTCPPPFLSEISSSDS
jgi:hypothetical protein